MTMRVTVKNEDETRTASVRYRDLKPSTGERAEESTTQEIAPGASAEFWIHSGRDLVVEEQ